MMKANMCFDIKHKHVDAAEMEKKLNGLDLSLYIDKKDGSHASPWTP